MAKSIAGRRKHNAIDINNLSQRDVDMLTLETKALMKKYKLEKQNIYDRRFALSKKLKEAGLSAEEVLGNNVSDNTEEVAPEAPVKKQPKKRGPKKATAPATPAEPVSESRDLMVVSKQVPVIMKPIEINFDNFSVKLNGMPKKISVNPDTNAIEIDL